MIKAERERERDREYVILSEIYKGVWNNNCNCRFKSYLRTLLGSFSSHLQYPMYFKSNWLYIPIASCSRTKIRKSSRNILDTYLLYRKRDNQNIRGALFWSVERKITKFMLSFCLFCQVLFPLKIHLPLLWNFQLDVWFPVS